MIPWEMDRKRVLLLLRTYAKTRNISEAARVVGMTSFGASAPLKDVMKKFGFTVDNVARTARELVGK